MLIVKTLGDNRLNALRLNIALGNSGRPFRSSAHRARFHQKGRASDRTDTPIFRFWKYQVKLRREPPKHFQKLGGRYSDFINGHPFALVARARLRMEDTASDAPKAIY